MYAYCTRPLTESLSITDSPSELMGQTVDDPNRTIVRLPPSNLPKISYTTFPQHPNELLPEEATNIELRTRDSLARDAFSLEAETHVF